MKHNGKKQKKWSREEILLLIALLVDVVDKILDRLEKLLEKYF